MTNDEKFRLQRRTFLRSLWQSLSGTPDFPVKLVMAALYLIGAVYVCVRQAAWRTLAGNIPLLLRCSRPRWNTPCLPICWWVLRCCWHSCSIPLVGGQRKTSFNVSV